MMARGPYLQAVCRQKWKFLSHASRLFVIVDWTRLRHAAATIIDNLLL